MSELRALGTSGLRVTPVALGCWPIAGMTSLHVNDDDSRKTLHAALDRGINHLDTAYCYGAEGESERLVGEAIAGRRDQVVLATKCGVHWNAEGQRVFEAGPERLREECETSLRRLQVEAIDLLYLHAPDPQVPLEDSAGALLELMQAGKARAIGVSNVDVNQLQRFASTCPVSAIQPHYNMLQREIEADLLPWCVERNIAVLVYWPLMKGLLAGKLRRDHRFEPGDGRAKYPMFQGEEWQRNQDFVDRLRELAKQVEATVAQLVIAWTIQRPGITSALCGAKRAAQIEETAAAMQLNLSREIVTAIDEAIDQRGSIKSKSAV